MANLASRMRTLAWSGEYEHGSISRRIKLTDEQKESLLDHAAKLEALTLGVSTAQQIAGTWARARRFWCNLTGEPLI